MMTFTPAKTYGDNGPQTNPLVSFQKTWTTLLAGGIPFHVAGTNEKTMATLKGEDK